MKENAKVIDSAIVVSKEDVDSIILMSLDDPEYQSTHIEITPDSSGYIAIAAVRYNKDPELIGQLTQQCAYLQFDLDRHPVDKNLRVLNISQIHFNEKTDTIITHQNNKQRVGFITLEQPQDI